MKLLIVFVAFIAIVIWVIIFATRIYRARYSSDVKSALQQQPPGPLQILTEGDIAFMPEMVQRYIRFTGALGKPVVKNMKISFAGQIRAAEESPWMKFTTEQYNFQDATWRLFFMKAQMKGLPVSGYHAFKNGIAFMDIRLLSLVKVQYQDGERMNVAETVTFFNDMCCIAPGSLVDDRIEWLESEGNAVKAAFTNNGIRITAWLHFNDEGALVNFISDDRWALEANGSMAQVRWETPLHDYMEISGHRLPSKADLIYKYPEGDFCYGKFKIVTILYNTNK
jgi:hypothetical protein